jgi:hypothetical protein
MQRLTHRTRRLKNTTTDFMADFNMLMLIFGSLDCDEHDDW